MSFGGGSGGQIRYALLLDDQATSKLNTFKNSLTQLGTGTTQVQSKIQGFTAQLTKQAQAFSAGINPIKQQGAALTGLTTNLKSHATQMTSVGTKIKDTTSKFAGFATGLSTTTSGILQLNAGFRDYGDSQIAVDKAQRKLSLSQEALNKATDKLQSLTSKGIKSGKEYAQAQLDVKQAQDGLAISTQLVGERQEDMFDAQTQFVASVIPTTLGAVGTLGSAYKDLGLNMNKITGGLGKLKGGLSSISGSLGMSTKGFIGMAGAIGLATVAAIEFFDQIKRGGEIKELQAFNETLAATNVSRQKEIDKLREQKNSWGQIMKDWVFSGPIGKAIVGDPGSVIIDQVIKSLESKISTVDASKPLEKLFTMIANSPIPASAKTGIQAQIQHILDIYNNKTNWQNPEFTKTSQGIVNDLITTLSNSIKSADLTTGLTGAMRTMFTNIFKGVEFSNSPMTQLFAIDPKPIAASLDPIGALYKKTMDKIIASNKVGAEFTRLFGDKNKIAADSVGFLKQKMDESNTGMDSYNAAIQAGVDKFNDLVTSTELGIVTNNKYRQALIQSVGSQIGFKNASMLSTAELALNQRAMLGDVDAIKELNAEGQKLANGITDIANKYDVRLNPALIKTTQQLADATSAVSEWDKAVTELRDPKELFGLKPFKIKFEVEKEFQDFFKDLPKGLKKNITLSVKSEAASENAKRVLEMIGKTQLQTIALGIDFRPNEKGADKFIDETIDQLKEQFKRKGQDLKPDPAVQQAINKLLEIKNAPDSWTKVTDYFQSPEFLAAIDKIDPQTQHILDALLPLQTISTSISAIANKIGADLSQGIKDFFGHGAGLDFGEGGGEGIIIPIAPPDLTKFNQGITTAKTSVADIAKTIPAISVNNKQAIQLINQTQKLWTNTAKIHPALTVINKQANSLIEQTQKLWTNTAKIHPTLTLKIEKALNQVDSIVKRIQDISNLHPTVNVGISGPGAKLAAHGMHENLLKDTLIMAHAGERVDIGPGSKDTAASVFRGGGGGSGSGGDIINITFRIDGNDIVNTREFKRQIKREGGTSRYTMGA